MAPSNCSEERFQLELDWNLLKVFNQIAKVRGVSSAAVALGRGQPAVSEALRRLEAALGVRLCRRGPRGFELTDEGQLLAEVCLSIEQLLCRIPADIADPTGVVHGTVRIAAISSLAAPVIGEAFNAFRRRCPQVELDVEVAPWDVVESRLLRDQADVGLAPIRTFRPDLVYELLFREAHRLYCGRAHPRYGRSGRDPAELTEEAFVLTGADEPEALRDFRRRHGLGRRVGGQSDHLEEVRRMVLAGVGIGFLPEALVAQEVARGELWPLTEPCEDLAIDVYVISRREATRQRLRDAFLTVLHEVAQRPPQSRPTRARRAPAAGRRPAPASRRRS